MDINRMMELVRYEVRVGAILERGMGRGVGDGLRGCGS
jgi:hypothetical protein